MRDPIEWAAIRMRTIAAIFAILSAAVGADISGPRPVWTGAGVNLLGGPSRDGRFVSYVDPVSRNLAIRELATGQVRTLTQRGGGEFAYFSAVSRDAAKVAYSWFNSDGFYELRVVDTDGKNQRVLFRNEEAGFVQPCAWTPDDKHVLTLLFRKDNISQIALVPLDGGPVRTLRSLMWVYPKRMDLSPDGQFIVYDSFAKDGAGDRTIFLLDASGKAETKLIDQPGNYLFPLWTSDGKRVLFIADHEGTTDLWSLDVSEGRAQGKPRLVRRDLGRALPMGIAEDGQYIYGVRTGETDVFVTTLTAAKADAQRASVRYAGRNMNPIWSADGHLLAYLSRRGSENFGQEARAIVLRSLQSGEERELLPPLAHMEQIRLSPDGASLLVSGSDGKGRAGLFTVDAKTAAVTPVIREADAPFRGYEGVWLRDSIVYLYRGKEVRSRKREGGDAVLYTGANLHHLVASPDGSSLAVVSGSESIVVIAGAPRVIPFDGVTELDWSRDLIAGKGAELWRIPLDGETPVQLDSPGNRRPGFSAHPDGSRVALTVSNERSEIWTLRIAAEP
jgi:Tol biopolymer transport system component